MARQLASRATVAGFDEHRPAARLGFAGALAGVGPAARCDPAGLLLFNIGIEIGQITFVALVLIAGHVLIRHLPRLTTSLRWLPPYAIGSFASFWVIERIHAFF
jgi:hypothetical protein